MRRKRPRYKCPECKFTHRDALQVVAHRVEKHPKKATTKALLAEPQPEDGMG
jgi:hypothetical protein